MRRVLHENDRSKADYPRQGSNNPIVTRESVQMAHGALQYPVQSESKPDDLFLAMMIDAAPKLSETEKNAVLVLVQTLLGLKSASGLSDAADTE